MGVSVLGVGGGEKGGESGGKIVQVVKAEREV